MSATAHKLPVIQIEPRPIAEWDYRKYGSITDPFHKSHASSLLGQFACTEQFYRDRLREARREQRENTSGKTEAGTAGHETILRALTNEQVSAAILAGKSVLSTTGIRKVLEEEFAKATAGKNVVWYGKAEQDDTFESITAMLGGLFADLHRHVAEIVLAEAGFIAPVGEYWTEGHVDLIYRPRSNPNTLGLTDWKTGAIRPHQIELDHGFESGLYSNAIYRGRFLPVRVLERWWADSKSKPEDVPFNLATTDVLASALTQREAMHIALREIASCTEAGLPVPGEVVRFDEFPAEIRLTQLTDYEPYEKKGGKTVEREEELEHWARVLKRPVAFKEKVNYEAGMTRGPAWYRVRRSAGDIKRLEHRLATLISWVRNGLFVDAVGEKCTRCSHREPCLTSGYEMRGEDAKALDAALESVDLDSLGGMEL